MAYTPADYANSLVNTTHVIMFQDYMTGDWIALGRDSYCSARMEGFGSPELRSNEYEYPGQDGIGFGFEYLGSRKWTIQGAIKGPVGTVNGTSVYNMSVPSSPESTWDELSRLLRAWDYNKARLKSRDVVELYWHRPGREAVLIYGRPERIDAETSTAHTGYITYTAVFRQGDPKFYSTVEQSEQFTLLTATPSGIIMNAGGTAIAAVDGRMQTSPSVTIPKVITVGGDIPAPPIITFTGPVTNPSLSLVGANGGNAWTVSIDGTIDPGYSVTVDTRLWKRTTMSKAPNGSQVSWAGNLRGSRLSDVLLPLGTSTYKYTGTGGGQASLCTIKYRNAWAAV
jgi:hypothetical protein